MKILDLSEANRCIARTRVTIAAMRKKQHSIDATIAVTFNLVIETKEKLRALARPGDPWR